MTLFTLRSTVEEDSSRVLVTLTNQSWSIR